MSRRYHITGIFGEAENGKTTYMVDKISRELQSGIHYDEARCNLQSVCDRNPKIKFINYHDLVTFRGPTKDGVARTIIALDQFHKYLDSRKSQSPLNILTSQVMIESRQHGFDTIFTTWAKSSVDKRVRPFTNLFVLAQAAVKGFEYEFIDKSAGQVQDGGMPWEYARRVWQRFDSTELIEDPTIPSTKAECQELEAELKKIARKHQKVAPIAR